MLNGYPCFPGVMDKIFRVVGTPTEDNWPGVARLPNYKPQKLCYYRGQRLGHVWPRLYDLAFAESLASMMLQQRAGKRVGAEQALRHRYFSDLPPSIHDLGDGKESNCIIHCILHLLSTMYVLHRYNFLLQRNQYLKFSEFGCGQKRKGFPTLC